MHLNERLAEVGLLYFSPNNQFALVYGTVIQRATSETLSQGDGRVIYLGTWKFDGSAVRVEYRLVSRTVPEEGEKLPGPVEEKTLRWRGGILLFDKTMFKRDKRLDDQLLSVLQDESARVRHYRTGRLDLRSVKRGSMPRQLQLRLWFSSWMAWRGDVLLAASPTRHRPNGFAKPPATRGGTARCCIST
jgi:hypothetical protein